MNISAEFPFESKYATVHGARMHYVEQGSGDPMVFLHGNPTSSYLWRNVMPHLSGHARCIAPDLIGMGKSDKPNCPYRFADHSFYVDGFIKALDLRNITFVIHDWGSALGFHYARRHPDNVRGLAFMEALLRPFRWDQFPKDFKMGFKLMRTPGVGWVMVSVMNVFLKQILPQTIVRTLSPEEQRRYEEPFPTIGSRKPVRQWPREIPIDGTPGDVHEIIATYSEWLQKTPTPKLLIHATPGAVIRADTVAWARERFPNLETVDVGDGIHFLQEDHPHEIGEAVATWFRQAVGR